MGLIHRIIQAGCTAWVIICGLLSSGILPGGSANAVGRSAAELPQLMQNLFGDQLPIEPRGEIIALETAVDPETYLLGPGDELTIVVWGDLEANFQVIVNPDGSVIIPTVGSGNVAGVSLAHATQTIIEMVNASYRAEQVTVALTRVRSFLVSVGGAVKKPGTVEIHGGQRVDAAILEAEGFALAPESPIDTTRLIQAAPRLIKIKRANGGIDFADLLLFMKTGNKDVNPMLKDGDVVEVPFKTSYGSQIGVFGAFRTPGLYDYTTQDRLSTAAQLGGGLSSMCDLKRAFLVRFSDDSIWAEIPVDLQAAIDNPGTDADLQLEPSDRLFVAWKPNLPMLHQVEVSGQVLHPGSFPILPGRTTLSEIIAQAGGLMPDAALERAQVLRSSQVEDDDWELARLEPTTSGQWDQVEREYRKFGWRQFQSVAVVDFETLFTGQDASQDILMMDGDLIRIPKRQPSVRVMGQVMYPGYIPWEPGMTFSECVTRAGGFAPRADRRRTRVISGQSDAWFKPDVDTIIHEGDTVFIPEKEIHDPQLWWKYMIEGVAVVAQVMTILLVIQNIKE